jgi:predicted nucleic acid-binding protein
VILVDSSVWVDYFNGTTTPETDFLDSMLGAEPIAIGDLILVEVLQGFRNDRDYRQAKYLLTSVSVYQLLDEHRAVRTAENYRTLRKLGATIRKTTDMIIGTYCIETRTPLLYSDRDFDPMVIHLDLKSALARG